LAEDRILYVCVHDSFPLEKISFNIWYLKIQKLRECTGKKELTDGDVETNLSHL
jgi:hypothetical protein